MLRVMLVRLYSENQLKLLRTMAFLYFHEPSSDPRLFINKILPASILKQHQQQPWFIFVSKSSFPTKKRNTRLDFPSEIPLRVLVFISPRQFSSSIAYTAVAKSVDSCS